MLGVILGIYVIAYMYFYEPVTQGDRLGISSP